MNKIKISEWYTVSNNRFEAYAVYPSLNSMRSTVFVPGLDRLDHIREVAKRIIGETLDKKLENPEYDILLDVGEAPCICGAVCNHYRHTRKPKNKLVEELENLLNSEVLQEQVRQESLLPPVKIMIEPG